MIPIRWIFRSRWAAIAWSIGICISVARFAGGDAATVDAGASAEGAAAAASALNAEDPE